MKQETLEEACLNYSTDMLGSFYEEVERAFAKGAKWQQERSYSEEDIKTAFLDGWELKNGDLPFPKAKKKWFEEFKKK